jgi:hypothetical protein
MNKKILFIIFITAVIFLPTTIANASQVYVEVQITNDEQPGGESFDLLAGTEMSIWEGSTQKGNTKILDSAVAVGETITSNLVDLENGNSYTLRLQVPLCFDGGIYDERGPYCWYKGTAGQNCNQVCSANNTTILPGSNCIESDPDCIMLTAFFGSIDSCRSGDFAPSLFTGWGYDTFWWGGSGSGDWCSYPSSGSDYQRICACQFQTGTFNFPFTASF